LGVLYRLIIQIKCLRLKFLFASSLACLELPFLTLKIVRYFKPKEAFRSSLQKRESKTGPLNRGPVYCKDCPGWLAN
jgi:hypothetical protein